MESKNIDNFGPNKDIYIKNYSDIKKEYKIYSKKIEADINILTFDKDSYISDLKEKDGYILVAMNKIKSDRSGNSDIINYSKLKIQIIKNFKENNKNNKKVNIEIEKNKKIKKIEFQTLKFVKYDIYKINENICLLFVFLLNDFYLFKIYDNPDEDSDSLTYIQLKFDYYNKSIKYLFLGTVKLNNNLELSFLGKPNNAFIFFIFNLSSIINESNESNEIEYRIEERFLDNSQKIKLNKFNRGNNIDKYLFIEENSSYLIYKNINNKERMECHKLEITYKNDCYIQNYKYPILLKKSDKMYIIIDITKTDYKEYKSVCNIILGIFEIYYNMEKQVYNTKLLQEIYINKKSDNYNVDLLTLNNLIFIEEKNNKVINIRLDNNCLVEKIHEFKLDLTSLNPINNISDIEGYIRIYSYSKYEIKYITIINPNINTYASLITSMVKDQFNKSVNEDIFFTKKYNILKEESKEQIQQIEKMDEKLNKIAHEAVQATKDDTKYGDDIKMINKNINNNNNNINNTNQMNSNILNNEHINYINQISNQYNPLNQINQVNQRVLIDPRINQINYNQSMNQINLMNQLKNMQNQNNLNIYSSYVKNYLPINQHNYNNNINPNILKYQTNKNYKGKKD